MEKNWLDDNWVWLLVRGILAILFGIMAMVWPGITTVALAVLWGCWALVDGVINIVAAIFQGVGAFSSTRSQPRWMLIVTAILSLLIGILFVARPGTGVLSIVLWLGIVAIVWGIFLIFAAFAARRLGKDIDAAAATPA